MFLHPKIKFLVLISIHKYSYPAMCMYPYTHAGKLQKHVFIAYINGTIEREGGGGNLEQTTSVY